MNPGLVVKLRPSGPWRIGPDSGARNRVDVIYHSDSLYSAVTAAMARLGWLEEWLDATARNGAPAVSFSSCFPYLDDITFIVPPRTIWPPAPTSTKAARVRWKSARFVPLTVVQSILAGRRLDENQWSVDGPSDCLVPAGSPGPFRTAVHWSAGVDRLSGASERHSTACIEFRPGSGLWTVVSFQDDAAQARWSGPVKGAFRLLADTGFGGERSRGWGRSEAPQFTEGMLPDLVLPLAVEEVEVAEAAVKAASPVAPMVVSPAEPDSAAEPGAKVLAVEPAPTAEPKSPAAPEPVAEPETPAVEAAAPQAAVPAAETAPTAEPKPAAEPETPAVEAAPQAAAPVAEAAPTAEPEPVAEPETPAVEAAAPEAVAPVVEPAPTAEPKSPPEPEPVAEPETPAVEAAAPEAAVPVAEAASTAGPKSPAAPEPVAEPETPAVEAAAPEAAVPVAEAASTAGPKTPTAPESAAEPETPAVEATAPVSEPASTAEPKSPAEPESAAEPETPAAESAPEAAALVTEPATSQQPEAPAPEPASELPELQAPAVEAAPETQAPTAETPALEAAPPAPAHARTHPHWLLSLFTPAPTDSVDWRRGNYTAVARGGRVDSPAGSGELKKQIQMVAEGSVLYAEATPRGSAANVAPDGFAHPVFRAGFAVAIPLPEVR